MAITAITTWDRFEGDSTQICALALLQLVALLFAILAVTGVIEVPVDDPFPYEYRIGVLCALPVGFTVIDGLFLHDARKHRPKLSYEMNALGEYQWRVILNDGRKIPIFQGGIGDNLGERLEDNTCVLQYEAPFSRSAVVGWEKGIAGAAPRILTEYLIRYRQRFQRDYVRHHGEHR